MPVPAPFSISCTVDAPRALVYRVYTEPGHLQNWMSPEGFKTIQTNLDFRVGGTYHYGLEGPHGVRMWGRQVFREIRPNEQVRLIQSFSDEGGGLTRHPAAAAWPLEMLATTTFEDAGHGKTQVTISWEPHESDEAGNAVFDSSRAGMEKGFTATFAKLRAYLEAIKT